jgi:hypothetical protein
MMTIENWKRSIGGGDARLRIERAQTAPLRWRSVDRVEARDASSGSIPIGIG